MWREINMASIGWRSCVAALDRGATNAYSIRPRRRRILGLLLASAMITPSCADASSTAGHQDVPPHRSAASKAKHHTQASAPQAKRSDRVVGPRMLPAGEQSAAEKSTPPPQLPPDLTATRQAIELMRQSKLKDATALAATIGDPVARKLVEWTLLPNSDSPAGFERYAAFIGANPDWPGIRAAPARRSKAVAGAARRRHGAPLLGGNQPARLAGWRWRVCR